VGASTNADWLLMTTPDQIIAEARKWIGTPFRHDAEVLGAGCDCAHLINAVYSKVGAIHHVKFPQYHADFWKHAKYPEMHIVETMKKVGFKEITAAQVKPGDVVVLYIGKCWAHCLILTGPHTAIEAWPTKAKVAEINIREERLFRNHQKRFFTI
jgi:cell wall-associated NlpC family hydrolase